MIEYGIKFVYSKKEEALEIFFSTENERNKMFYQIADGTTKGFIDCGAGIINLSNIVYCGLIER